MGQSKLQISNSPEWQIGNISTILINRIQQKPFCYLLKEKLTNLVVLVLAHHLPGLLGK